MTFAQIADELGVNIGTVIRDYESGITKLRANLGIIPVLGKAKSKCPRKNYKRKRIEERVCEKCGKKFKTHLSRKRFCSRRCGDIARVQRYQKRLTKKH